MAHPDLESVVRRARAAGREAAMVARLTRDLPGWLRRPISLDQAQERARLSLAARDQRFLSVIERAVYGNPRSPYLQLLRHAGCKLGDVRRLVAREGIEGALQTLASAGVYVTFDERKGRREAVRGTPAR